MCNVLVTERKIFTDNLFPALYPIKLHAATNAAMQSQRNIKEKKINKINSSHA